jgi:hypothetical protein
VSGALLLQVSDAVAAATEELLLLLLPLVLVSIAFVFFVILILQVSDAVVAAIEELEPVMEAIYNAQTAAGQAKWNEHLAVDLRLAGEPLHRVCWRRVTSINAMQAVRVQRVLLASVLFARLHPMSCWGCVCCD